jgi:hypothetical protein
MWASPVVSVLLWTVALAATIWILVPAIAFAFNAGGGVQTTVLPEAGPPEIPGSDVSLEERLGQLAALGFRAAGRTRETARFLSPTHWRWEQYGTTRWFVSADGLTYVTLHRVVADEPVRISAVSLFDDGGLVRTSSPGTEAKEFSRPDYRRLGLRNVDARALLARHQEEAQSFGQERGSRNRKATVAEIAARDVAAERPLIRKAVTGGYGLVLMFVQVWMIAPLALAQQTPAGIIPLGICCSAGLYALMRWATHGPLLRYNARRSHREDLSSQPDYVAPDGKILAIGATERRLRILAAVGAALACAWPIAIAMTLPRTAGTGRSELVLCFTVIAASVLIIVQLWGRASGRMLFRPKGKRSPKDLWYTTTLMSFVMWSSSSSIHWRDERLRPMMLVVAGASLIVGVVGWRLERKLATVAPSGEKAT